VKGSGGESLAVRLHGAFFNNVVAGLRQSFRTSSCISTNPSSTVSVFRSSRKEKTPRGGCGLELVDAASPSLAGLSGFPGPNESLEDDQSESI